MSDFEDFLAFFDAFFAFSACEARGYRRSPAPITGQFGAADVLEQR
jgi:hypothetical protein